MIINLTGEFLWIFNLLWFNIFVKMSIPFFKGFNSKRLDKGWNTFEQKFLERKKIEFIALNINLETCADLLANILLNLKRSFSLIYMSML